MIDNIKLGMILKEYLVEIKNFPENSVQLGNNRKTYDRHDLSIINPFTNEVLLYFKFNLRNEPDFAKKSIERAITSIKREEEKDLKRLPPIFFDYLVLYNRLRAPVYELSIEREEIKKYELNQTKEKKDIDKDLMHSFFNIINYRKFEFLNSIPEIKDKMKGDIFDTYSVDDFLNLEFQSEILPNEDFFREVSVENFSTLNEISIINKKIERLEKSKQWYQGVFNVLAALLILLFSVMVFSGSEQFFGLNVTYEKIAILLIAIALLIFPYVSSVKILDFEIKKRGEADEKVPKKN